MEKLQNEKKRKIEYLFVAISCILIGGVYLFQINEFKSIGIVNDEFGYWGITAYFGGDIWRDLMETTPYYSFGYSLLMLPLYLMRFNTVIMYKSAIIFNVCLVMGSFLLSLLCSKKMFPEIEFKMRWMSCFVISFYTNTVIQAQIAWTETLLYFLVWLLLYILLVSLEKMSYKNIAVGCTIAVYMYCVHQRTIGIVVLYAVILLLKAIVDEENYKKIIFMILLWVILFALRAILKDYIVENLFTNDDLVAVNNIQGQTGKIKSILTTKVGFSSFLQSCVGKFYYIALSSCCIVPMAIFVWLKNILSKIMKFDLKKDIFDDVFLSEVFIILSFLSLIALTAISMYNGSERADFLVYGRYMEIAVGPILLYGFNKALYDNNIKKYSIAVIVICLLSNFVIHYGFMDTQLDSFNATCATAFYYFFKNATETSEIASFISIALVSSFLVFLFQKKRRLGYGLLALVWLSLSSFSGPINQQKYITQQISPILDVINHSEDQKKIVYLDEKHRILDGQVFIKYIQYYLSGNPIIYTNILDIDKVNWDKVDYVISDSSTKIPIKILNMFQIEEKNAVLQILISK